MNPQDILNQAYADAQSNMTTAGWGMLALLVAVGFIIYRAAK